MSERKDLDALALLLIEMGNEVRARRDPEHLYTAATIGAVGALAWGVAAVGASSTAETPIWRHPALIGALGCVAMAVVVVLKINREHGIYKKARDEQMRMAAQWAAAAGLVGASLPNGLIAQVKSEERGCEVEETVGSGHKGSIRIVVVASIVAAAFCMSVLLAK